MIHTDWPAAALLILLGLYSLKCLRKEPLRLELFAKVKLRIGTLTLGDCESYASEGYYITCRAGRAASFGRE